MNEPTEVEARFGAEGTVTLLSFTWQGRRLRVTSMGREWLEGEVKHFLVMAAADRIFELTHHPASGQWRLVGTPPSTSSA